MFDGIDHNPDEDQIVAALKKVIEKKIAIEFVNGDDELI